MKMVWTLIIITCILVAINLAALLFTSQKRFGRLPRGERLRRVELSPNYRDGEFRNLVPTPQLAEGAKLPALLRAFFCKPADIAPQGAIPHIKTDLKNLDPDEEIFVWLGHSSCFIQTGGRRILVDPVFCGHASPVRFMIKAFEGADVYKAEDMPPIDYLFITHDHWDHLDYRTVTALKGSTGKIVCGLGVGEHFERWGFDMSRVIEMDWEEEVRPEDGITIYCLTSRHFSGRGTKRNKSLWVSFLLQTPALKIYMGGDGGYGEHFSRIGERFGGIDISILENGQYNTLWKYIHCMPEQTLQAAYDLRTRTFVPVHSGKFALASHQWAEPLKRITSAFEEKSGGDTLSPRMLTPMIGEPVILTATDQTFGPWWNNVK